MWLSARGLLDGRGGPPVHNVVLEIADDRIVNVGTAVDFGSRVEGAHSLDLGQRWLMPGLIDMHNHLRLSHLVPDPAEQVHDAPVSYALHAVHHLRTNLLSGVTTMRCNGDRDFIDVEVRQAVASGLVCGPRLLVATRGIKATACTAGMVATVLADETDDICEAIRANVARGADHIKLFASGGLGPRETATRAFWDGQQITAAVAEAHALSVPIVAHCHGGPSARVLIEAGVDVLEHGSFLTDSELDLMAEHGTWLDMTLGILVHPASEARRSLTGRLGHGGLARMTAETLETMRRAVERGVAIVLGTDTMHGLLAVEAAQAAALGMSNASVVHSLTGRAAQALGKADQFGSVRPGLAADLVALEADPIADISALARVAFVMARGRVVKWPGVS
ncbi:MAG: amidohydrolase family protein [Chloroflexi bacterium]|nr:amidohydrolase family protein [Chloroflexota bacterium]